MKYHTKKHHNLQLTLNQREGRRAGADEMFPLKNYYESFIKKDIIGLKREVALKRLSNLLACQKISKDTVDVVHIRYFTCTETLQPTDTYLGTIAVKFANGYVIDSAISTPKETNKEIPFI